MPKKRKVPIWYPIPDEIVHLLSQIEAFYNDFILDMTLLRDFAPQEYDEITAWYAQLRERRWGAFKTGPSDLMHYLLETCLRCRAAGYTSNYTQDPQDWIKAFFAEVFDAYWEDIKMCCEVSGRWKMPEEKKEDEAW